MPVNTNLKPVELPMVLKFGQKPKTDFLNNLDALKVELVDSPTRIQAWNVAWHYVKATWADQPDIDPTSGVSDRELSKNLEDVLGGRTLPAPMECLGFTFRLSGLSFQEVTHIIRHRAGTFAAQCTGDRDLRDDAAVIPEPVQNSPEFLERWKKIVEDSKQLYADMTDSRVISMMDARLILPKCMTSFYYMRLPLKDLIGFIYQRIDSQIQPASDNLLASKMAVAVARVIPEFTSVIDFGNFLKTNTAIEYKSLDIAEDLKPDVVGSVTDIPAQNDSVDVACAFEVLEHLPFEKFDTAVGELARVARGYVVISLPHFGPVIAFSLKLPFLPLLRFSFKIPFYKKHTFNGQHYWEIGKQGYPVSKIRNTLSKYGTIERDFVPFGSFYHHFFVVKIS
jgi:thymidylate synthase (FAD)